MKLSSIPGLEDVTIEGLSQRKPAQANGQANGPANGPSTATQSQTGGPPAGSLRPPEVNTNEYKKSAKWVF